MINQNCSDKRAYYLVPLFFSSVMEEIVNIYVNAFSVFF